MTSILNLILTLPIMFNTLSVLAIPLSSYGLRPIGGFENQTTFFFGLQLFVAHADVEERKFIALIGGATIWSLGARAQQANRPRQIAVLMGTVETAPDAVDLKTVLDRLNTLGWTQGVTARID